MPDTHDRDSLGSRHPQPEPVAPPMNEDPLAVDANPYLGGDEAVALTAHYDITWRYR